MQLPAVHSLHVGWQLAIEKIPILMTHVIGQLKIVTANVICTLNELFLKMSCGYMIGRVVETVLPRRTTAAAI